ncbi:MAG: GAF domain-containing protein [Acidobacteria bacterium]|nr:GAF domain-containing protein [Acidobacteriota bacterium]
MPNPAYDDILQELAAASPPLGARELMKEITLRLGELPGFAWVGFYMIEPRHNAETEPMLVLGPFRGADTQHKRIPLNQGICGAAASSGETVVVDDVHSDPRYLACSIETQSEIVAPIRVRGQVVGELDIDSHSPAAFGPAERALVERCAAAVGRLLENDHQ